MKHNNFKVKLLTLCSLITLTFSSCADWLVIEPKTFVTEDNFWNEKHDVEQMVAGVYCMLQSPSIIERAIVWGELRSDNITDGKNVQNNDDLNFPLREKLLQNNKYTEWNQFYKTINAAQIVLERCPSVAEIDPTYTPSQVLATQAEMKAIKALCMFYLVRAFKDVPYPTHAYQSEDDIEPMYASDGDSIVRVLIAELEDCVGNALRKYPKDRDSDFKSDYNRITQTSIYALLCDLCLWLGGEENYQKVVKYAEKVIDQKFLDFNELYSKNVNMESGGRPVIFRWDNDDYTHLNGTMAGYPLYPCYQSSGSTYGSNFNEIFGKGNSFESVFELAYTPSSDRKGYLSNDAVKSLYGKTESSVTEGPLYAHENVVTDALNKVYKIYDHQYDIRYYINSHPGDDQFSKGYPGKYTCHEISATSLSGQLLPFEASYSGNSDDDHNWIFYRLTDVMLMEAEALVELAGDQLYTTDEETGERILDVNLNRAFGIVWAINRRSLMTPNYINTTSTTQGYVLKQDKYQTKEAMQELVQKERRRELMFEGKRFFDLIRRCHHDGDKTDYMRKNVSAKGSKGGSVTLFINYETLFWPYNKTELRSNTALKQKPQYADQSDDEKNYAPTGNTGYSGN